MALNSVPIYQESCLIVRIPAGCIAYTSPLASDGPGGTGLQPRLIKTHFFLQKIFKCFLVSCGCCRDLCNNCSAFIFQEHEAPVCFDTCALAYYRLRCEVTRCVSPWFIVGGEYSKVTATDKVLIVHRQQRTGGGQKLRMEDNLRGGGQTGWLLDI